MVNLSSKDKILIIRSSFLGDFVVCLPFLQFLYEDLGIDKKDVFTVILNIENVNPIGIIYGKDSVEYKNSTVLNPAKIFNFIGSMNKLKKDFGANKIIYLPFRLERNINKLKKYLLVKLSLGLFTPLLGFKRDNTHYNISQYYHLFDFFKIPAYSKFEFKVNIKNYEEPKFFFKKTLVIAIYPNSKLTMKIWPFNNYVHLIENLLKLYDAQILLIGGKEDYSYNEKFRSVLGVNENIINIAGQFSVQETIMLFRKVDILIGNDGFPLHLANLANTPIIGLFTYKNPIGCWDPVLSDQVITLRTLVACKECYKKECANPICLTSISVEDVLGQVKFMLNSEKNSKFKKIIVNQTIRSLNFKNLN